MKIIYKLPKTTPLFMTELNSIFVKEVMYLSQTFRYWKLLDGKVYFVLHQISKAFVTPHYN